MATRKNLKFKKKNSFKKRARKTQNKKRNYKKTKKCGCSIKFFGGKRKQRKQRKQGKQLSLKKQKGGAGLTALLPSEINNLGQSIYHSMKYNNAVYTGNDYPVNPHPSIQPNMNKHN